MQNLNEALIERRSIMKKILSIGLVIAMAASLTACGGSSTADTTTVEKTETKAAEDSSEPFFVKVATGQSGGTYYPIGIAMANIFSEHIPGCTSSGMATGGSVDNISLLQDGEAQIAMIMGTTARDAYNGDGKFDGKAYQDLTAICALWENDIQIIVPNEITKIEELIGKKIVVGANGSGGEIDTKNVLSAFDIYYNNEDASKNNIEAVYLDYAQGVDSLKDGQVQAVSNNSHAPASAITDLLSTGDYHILEFTDDEIDKIKAVDDLYDVYTIPANTYPNQDHDIKTLGYPVLLTCDASMPANQVYSIIDSIFTYHDDLVQAHAAAASITEENAVKGLVIPVHEGAEKYFTEKGLK